MIPTHDEYWPQIVRLRHAGLSLTEIADAMHLSYNALWYHLRKAKTIGNTLPKRQAEIYLGSLCVHGHDYQGTGQSMRYKSWGKCVECARDQWRRKYAEEKPV